MSENTVSESAIRSAARRIGWRVTKSRGRQHLNNRGLYQLLDDRNCVIAGADYDASLETLAHFINEDRERLPGFADG